MTSIFPHSSHVEQGTDGQSSEVVNLESLQVVADKLRKTEAPFKAAGDWRGLGVGAMALCVEKAIAELKQLREAATSPPAPQAEEEIEQLLKNAGLTSRDGTFVSAPTREIAATLRCAQATAEAPTWDCATCHDDPRECAKIPMRHCEKLHTASAARTYADGIEDAVKAAYDWQPPNHAANADYWDVKNGIALAIHALTATNG